MITFAEWLEQYGLPPAAPQGGNFTQNDFVWKGLYQRATPQEKTVLGQAIEAIGTFDPNLYFRLTGTPYKNTQVQQPMQPHPQQPQVAQQPQTPYR